MKKILLFALFFATAISNSQTCSVENLINSTISLPLNEWSYIAITKNGLNGSVCVNNTLITNLTWNLIDTPGGFNLGAKYSGSSSFQNINDDYFDGYIDELRISNNVRPILNKPTQEFNSDINTIGLYHFNNNMNNVSGSLNTFNNYNYNVTYEPMPNFLNNIDNTAIKFNGINSVLYQLTSQFTQILTIEFWVKPISYKGWIFSTHTNTGGFGRTGINTTSTLTINDFEENISIYPNPCTDKLNIDLISNNYYTLKLFNLIGQEVNTTKLSQLNTTINITYPKGIYILEIYRVDKLIYNKKIIID